MADHQEELLPERIWVDEAPGYCCAYTEPQEGTVEYIRADLARSAALPVEGELLPEIVTALMDTRNALQLLVSGIRTVPQNEPLEARIPVQLQAGDIKRARDVLLANADLVYRALASADLARSAPVVPQPAAHCNFCGESKPDLIPATVGLICKDCVGICASMVENKS